MIVPALLAIVAATFYALTNHIDKYLISKAVKNADHRSLLVVSTLIAGAVMSTIYLFICRFQISFDLRAFLILLTNAIIVTVAYILYFRALSREDTTIVAIMFQLIPVFILVADIFARSRHLATAARGRANCNYGGGARNL